MSTAPSDARRARIAIVVATVLLTAFFFASGSAQLVASALLDVPMGGAGGLPDASHVTARRRAARAGEPILRRNIFDSTTGAIPWEDPPAPVSSEAAEDEVVVDPGNVEDVHPPCEGSIRLVGAYVRPNLPEQSFAAVINATGTSLLYREGMMIDDRLVMVVERHRVVLRTAGSTLCDLNMFGSTTPAATPVAGLTAPAAPVVIAEAPTGAETGGVEASDLDANIHQVSETNYTINRGLVDRLMANQAALMSAARVIPHEEDGRTVGMKIYGIRRSSLLGRLGVQNGDMLRTINGFEFTDANALLQAYTQLRSADHLTLQLVRRGSPVSVDYQIQ